MVVQKHLWAVLVLASCAAAQNGTTATVQNVTVAREGTDVRVEITLSAPVTPSVDTAVKPNRILLDLPETIPGTSPKAVPVNDNGVRQVRTGQHSTLPLVTRVVVDLDQLHLYSVTTEGNRIILSVVAPDKRAMSRSVPVRRYRRKSCRDFPQAPRRQTGYGYSHRYGCPCAATCSGRAGI